MMRGPDQKQFEMRLVSEELANPICPTDHDHDPFRNDEDWLMEIGAIDPNWRAWLAGPR